LILTGQEVTPSQRAGFERVFERFSKSVCIELQNAYVESIYVNRDKKLHSFKVPALFPKMGKMDHHKEPALKECLNAFQKAFALSYKTLMSIAFMSTGIKNCIASKCRLCFQKWEKWAV
jgi:hypothetical protein